MKPSDKQVGGNHYKQFAIQPSEFIIKNNLGFLEGNVIKYVCRHQIKGGVEDINKAIHYLELIKEHMYESTTDERQPDPCCGRCSCGSGSELKQSGLTRQSDSGDTTEPSSVYRGLPDL